MSSQPKISLFSKKCPPRSPTPKRIEDTMVAVVGIQHMFILEEVGPVAQMEEGHYNGKLFGAACLLRKHGPYFDQIGRG